MEMALLLIVLVIAELALTVWFLARQKYYLTQLNALVGEVAGLEHDVTLMGDKLGFGTHDDNQVTEEDLKQAAGVIRALGLDKD